MNQLDASCEQRLRTYEALLLRWNARINLVSARDASQIWSRHIADSLRLSAHIPSGSRLIDLGSGGGFPGLVLGIACQANVTLVESDQRKCAFLREAARVCEVRADVQCRRIETLECGAVPFVTARALAPLKVLLGWTQTLLTPEGVALFPKGRTIGAELEEARRLWTFNAEMLDEPVPSEGVILRVSDIRKAG